MFFKNRKATFGASVLLLIVLAAVFAPLITSNDPLSTDYPRAIPPSGAHPFGTTDYAQDILAQALYGARISLIVATVAATIATVIATTFGLLAAYRPGFVDNFVNMITNIFLVIPGLPLLIVISAFIPERGAKVIAPLLGFTSWAFETRILRGQALGLRGRDFIMAAKMTGESTMRIIFGEFVPNMISRIVAGFIITFTAGVFGEAGLEFLGFGDPHQVTWGTMLYWAANGSAVASGHWWQFVFPGLCISLTIVGLVFLQYGVDELSNPKLRNLPKVKRRRFALASRLIGMRPRGEEATA
jgi:peptide/nickel transport system permease protein